MAKSQISFNKKEKEKKRAEKKQAKQQRTEERRSTNSGGLDNMIAYVDEFGRITDTLPDPSSKQKIDLESIDVSVRKREDVYEDPTHNGKVDFFNSSKGFGFIRETGSGMRYFVHVNGLLQPVIEGDTVTFELERGQKGMNAVKVKKK
jgi:cold shock CspA family protein